MGLGVAPVTRDPNHGGNDVTDAEAETKVSPAWSWVRPVAAVLLLLSAGTSLGMVTRYLQGHASITTQPNSSLFAAAVVSAVIAVMALSVLVFQPERGELWSLVKTSAAWSIALLLALAVAWVAIAGTERPNRWHGTLVTNAAEVNAYLGEHLPT